MTKNLIGLGMTWLLAACAMGQSRPSKLPDPKLFEGCKTLSKTEKPAYTSILVRRESDGAFFSFDYFVEASAKTAMDEFRHGPHDHTLADWVALLDFMEVQFNGKTTVPPLEANPFVDLPPAHHWTAPAR